MTLPPFKLERYFARHEFTAPYLLCASDCEAMSIGELLALQPAFTGGDRQELLRQIAFEEPRQPRRLNSAIPLSARGSLSSRSTMSPVVL